jgi:hypothetical protein
LDTETEVEFGVVPGLPEAERARKGPFLEVSEAAQFCKHHGFRHLVSKI